MVETKGLNYKIAHENPKVLQEKIDKEVIEGRMAGPFHTPPIHNFTHFVVVS